MWNIYGLVGIILLVYYIKITLTWFGKFMLVLLGMFGGIFTLILGITIFIEEFVENLKTKK